MKLTAASQRNYEEADLRQVCTWNAQRGIIIIITHYQGGTFVMAAGKLCFWGREICSVDEISYRTNYSSGSSSDVAQLFYFTRRWTETRRENGQSH